MPLIEKISTPVVVFFLAVIFVLFVKQSGFTIPLEITTTTKSTEMAVVGEGKVEAVPVYPYYARGVEMALDKTGGGAPQPDIESGT